MANIINFEQQLEQSPRERCSQLIEDVQRRYDVILTIRDNLGILRLPSGEALLHQRAYHIHHYCELERQKHPDFNRACNAHCADYVSRRSRVDPSPFVSCCWKGMREVIVPVWRGGHYCITMFAAGMRDHKRTHAPDAHTFSQTVIDAYEELPVYDDERARELVRVLYTLGLGILQEIDNLYFTSDSSNERKNQIQKFIHYHAHHECKITDLAKYMFLSPSRCSQVVRDLFQKSFQDLVIAERIERASHLLTSTELNQEQIATQCGFQNHFYFNRLFKKITGQTPGYFRKQHSN